MAVFSLYCECLYVEIRWYLNKNMAKGWLVGIYVNARINPFMLKFSFIWMTQDIQFMPTLWIFRGLFHLRSQFQFN